MQKNHSAYINSPAKIPPSPRLLKSKSRNSITSPPKIRPTSSNSFRNPTHNSKTKETNRDKVNAEYQTVKRDEGKDKERVKPKYRLVKRGDASVENHLQGSKNVLNTDKAKRIIRSAPTSPSAWALSPGRASLPSAQIVQKSQSIHNGKSKTEWGTSSGSHRSGDRILNFFGLKKKVSRVQEEELHRFRVLQNRLLQWRFVNARVEKSTRVTKTVAKKKLLNAWLRLDAMRNSILEKRMQIQKMSNEVKLYQVIVPHMCFLNQWAKLETRNTEAVRRITSKLSLTSVMLPLVHGAKGDVRYLHDILKEALGSMNNIQVMAAKFLPQAENICFLLTELELFQTQQEECLNELEYWFSTIIYLQAEERFLRAHLLQSAN